MNLTLVVTVLVNDNGDDNFSNIIGVYENFDKALEIRDKINNNEKIPGLDYSSLSLYDRAEIITRNLNETLRNSNEE